MTQCDAGMRNEKVWGSIPHIGSEFSQVIPVPEGTGPVKGYG